jgi:hypothetical protein
MYCLSFMYQRYFVSMHEIVTSCCVARNAHEGVRFEVCTALTTKNAVFWDIKPSPYLTGNTLRLRYRAQPVNAM